MPLMKPLVMLVALFEIHPAPYMAAGILVAMAQLARFSNK
jgi:hypothetical protein